MKYCLVYGKEPHAVYKVEDSKVDEFCDRHECFVADDRADLLDAAIDLTVCNADGAEPSEVTECLEYLQWVCTASREPKVYEG